MTAQHPATWTEPRLRALLAAIDATPNEPTPQYPIWPVDEPQPAAADTAFQGLYARRPDLLTKALEAECERLVREYGRVEKGVNPADVRAELARIARILHVAMKETDQ